MEVSDPSRSVRARADTPEVTVRSVRSLASTVVTLLVLAAVAVVLAAFALPRVQVPGLDTTGVEQRAQGLVQSVTTTGGAWVGEGVAVVTGAVEGAVQGAQDAAAR